MSQYILINNIKVQNANAIAGFTWGFPAITHFLGFTHNLSRKLSKTDKYNEITLNGCAVISHKHHVHTYDNYGKQFSQLKTAAYLSKDIEKNKKTVKSPSIIEEGRMNMTVSLLIEFSGYIGSNSQDDFGKWLNKNCYLQRLAGGTILSIGATEIYNLNDNDKVTNLRIIKRKLLPGFALLDRSTYLKEHYHKLNQEDEQAELLDAWFDFIELKQKARPKSDLINTHINKLVQNDENKDYSIELLNQWTKHLELPYEKETIPKQLMDYFSELENNKQNKDLIIQWQNYCNPNDKTDAIWDYLSKPNKGYLVPIMIGYKAISQVYPNKEVDNTRDHETDVCFVESVHSIGEWQSIHRIKTVEELNQLIWRYNYKENWYLCNQDQEIKQSTNQNSY